MGRPKGSKNNRLKKECVVCRSVYMAGDKRGTICSQDCRNKKFNGTYKGSCLDCGSKTYHFSRMRCRPCAMKKKTSDAIVRKKDRFFKNVKKTSTCWLWTGATQAYGYGYFGFRGVCYLAHRVSCEMVHGEIPEGMQALHKCDNPPCVNPEHLYIGTPLDNALDRKNKERWSVCLKR